MKNIVFLAAALVLVLAVMGFQCSSAEMTSAKMYIQRSDWANAERSLEQEVAKNPNNAEAWYLLGRARMELKNYKGMNEAFTRSLAAGNQFEKDIKSVRLALWGQLFNSGVDAYLKGKKAQGDSAAILLQKSVENFNTAILLNPDSASTYTNLGLSYLALNDFEDAARNFEIALQKEKDPDLTSSLANMYVERGRKFQTEAQGASSAKKDSLQKVSKHNFDKAISTLEQGRQWWADNLNVVSSLLDAYLAAGRTEEAMNNFKLAVEKSPNNRLYRYNYGVLLLKAGNHKEAVEQFEASVVVDPKFEDALYNLSVAYLQWGAKRRSEAEASAKSGGKDRTVEKSYEEQFRKAKETLERLRDLKPNDPDVWEALGQAYANLNMAKLASEAFAKADALRKSK